MVFNPSHQKLVPEKLAGVLDYVAPKEATKEELIRIACRRWDMVKDETIAEVVGIVHNRRNGGTMKGADKETAERITRLLEWLREALTADPDLGKTEAFRKATTEGVCKQGQSTFEKHYDRVRLDLKLPSLTVGQQARVKAAAERREWIRKLLQAEPEINKRDAYERARAAEGVTEGHLSTFYTDFNHIAVELGIEVKRARPAKVLKTNHRSLAEVDAEKKASPAAEKPPVQPEEASLPGPSNSHASVPDQPTEEELEQRSKILKDGEEPAVEGMKKPVPGYAALRGGPLDGNFYNPCGNSSPWSTKEGTGQYEWIPGIQDREGNDIWRWKACETDADPTRSEIPSGPGADMQFEVPGPIEPEHKAIVAVDSPSGTIIFTEYEDGRVDLVIESVDRRAFVNLLSFVVDMVPVLTGGLKVPYAAPKETLSAGGGSQ